MTGIVTTQFNSLPNGPSANGNAMASIEFDLVADEIVSIDVNNGAPGQGLSRIESLYVDNTRGGGYLFFVFNDVKRLLIVPPGAEGCYPTYSAASYFRVGQAKSANGVHVRCKAFACTKHSFERFPGAGGLLQNPLDFNNTNGATPAAAVASAQIIPPVTGWSKMFASPKVTFPLFNRVVTNNITAPTTIVWSTSHTVSTAGGPRYFELTFEGIGGFDGIGLARHTEETEGSKIAGNALVVSNGVIYNVFPGSADSYEYGIFQPNGSGAPADSVVGFVIDMLHGAMSVISANNYVAQASHHGLGNSYGINLADFNFAAFAYSPAIRLTGNGSSLSCTANTSGPFHYAAQSAPYLAWDSSTSPPIYNASANTPVTVTPVTTAPVATAPTSGTTWRLLIHATAQPNNGAGASVPTIAGIEFATAAGGANIATSGTPLSSSDYPGYPATNAFDGNPATWWNCNGAAPPDQYIQYTFPSAVSIAELRITPRADSYGAIQSPASFDLQVSSDGVAFTTVKTYSAPTWAAGQAQTFTVVPAPVAPPAASGSPYSFKYWRIAIHDNAAHIITSLQELIFASVVGGPSICKGGVPGSQTQQGNYPVANAFDNSPSFWISSASVPPDQWIEYNFGAIVSPVEVRLVNRPDGYGANESATSFDVLGSNDGVNYTLVSKNTATPWSTPNQVQAFAIPVHP